LVDGHPALTVIYSSDLSELLQWLFVEDSTINIVPAFSLLFFMAHEHSRIVMDDSEISILDSIRFFEKNLDFELRAVCTAYKGLE